MKPDMKMRLPLFSMLATAPMLWCAVGLALLMLLSLFVGVTELNWSWQFWDILVLSRLPRTFAIVLAGSSLAIAGIMMQQLARNRFVEPTTTGTVECAMLAIVLLALWLPNVSLMVKMIIASLGSCVGTLFFLLLMRRLPMQTGMLVPLAGLIFSGVINAVVVFIAYQNSLLQALSAWVQGDFSAVVQGRYELLWLVLLITLIAYWFADRFTLVGLGQSMSESLGLNYRRYFFAAIVFSAIISGITVASVGILPFIGLVVPNLVSQFRGDNLRRNLPLVAMLGAMLVLVCDIISRLILFPYEMGVSVIMGMIGSALVVYLLLHPPKPSGQSRQKEAQL